MMCCLLEISAADLKIGHYMKDSIHFYGAAAFFVFQTGAAIAEIVATNFFARRLREGLLSQ